jgi:hypothetical protein
MHSKYLINIWSSAGGVPKDLEESIEKAWAYVEKAWAYVGRFLWLFALVETVVNEIFVKLFDLKGASLIFLGQGTIDFRKKLDLIKVVLSLRGENPDLFGKLHHLIMVRNVIAHCAFDYDEREGGIDFDYVDKKGKLILPKEIRGGREDEDTIISFEQLDLYDEQLAQVWDELQKLLHDIRPITHLAPEVQAKLEKVIEQSDNVYRFPRF